MQASSSSSRVGAIVSLAGAILIQAGFFLPMFMEGNPSEPGSIHPTYEWQAVTIVDGFPNFAILFRLLAIIPLLGMLIILATSSATLFQLPFRRLNQMNRIAAGLGLGVQLLFNGLVFEISLIGYARTDPGWGFAIVPIGFIVSVIGAFFIRSQPRRE
jgi:hypothetical protein